jgi:hypothetical protein
MFSTKGDALSPGEKSVPSTHKQKSPFVQPPKKNSARVRTDDLWVTSMCKYNFKPMVIFHPGTGRLSRGIGEYCVCKY